jgi:predicted ATPase
MTAVLVTGLSGTGKSSVLAELAGLGHRTVDTDYGDWIEVDTTDPIDVVLARVIAAGGPTAR